MQVKPDDDALRWRVFTCPICSKSADRDFTAVLNLLGLFPFSPKADELLGEGPVVPMNLTLEANLLHPKTP